MNRSEEIRALGALTGDVLGESVHVVERVHRAISDRVDSALPAPARPMNAIVRATTTATYAAVRAGHRWIPRGAATIAAARTPADAPSMLHGPVAAKAVASVNGIWGHAVTDRLDATSTLALLHDGDPLTPVEIAELVDARGNLVVFAHGLAETEADWNRQPRGADERRTPYQQRLEADAPVTSLSVRYSTGHAISDTGAELAALLEGVTRAWPVPVSSITLVGHSMGGLIARSAAHHAHLGEQDWVRRLRLIITLGTPHLGAPLSKAVDLAERVLNAFPETAPLGDILGSRSAGVRDLSEGRIHGDRAAALDPPPVPGVTHCTLGSTLTHGLRHPVGMLVGDGLVRLTSASGRGRTRRLDFQVDKHLGGLGHMSTLNDQAVYDLIRAWTEEFALT